MKVKIKNFTKILIICAVMFSSTFAKAGSFTVSGSSITLDLDVASQLVTVASTGTTYTFTLSGGATNAWTGTTSANVTVSGAVLTITSAGKTAFSTVDITDSQTGTRVAFATSGANTYSDNLNITLDNTAGAITFAGSSAFDGSNALNIVTDGYISFPSASSLSSVNGNINLSANMQATPNAFLFSGIKVETATVQITGTGELTMRARGGVGIGSSHNNRGIAIVNGGVVKGGTTGTTTIEGRGYTGVAGTTQGQGVFVFNANGGAISTITSNGANVLVTGYGANSTAAAVANQCNIGVAIGSASASAGTQGGTITAGGTGTVTINGYGGSAANPVSSISTHMYGVFVAGSNVLVSSNGGNVVINGTGGGPDSLADYNHGINVFKGVIQPGTNGNLTITGTGGNVKSAGANGNYGIMISDAVCKVQCGLGSGNVLITGTGAGLFTTTGLGVYVTNSGTITSLGTGTVTVIGYGAPNAAGNTNRGVFITTGTSNISSGGGNVVVTGYGGGIGASTFNVGVNVQTGGFITAGGNGTVTVTGYGGNNTGTGANNHGVFVTSSGSSQAEAYITSSGGNVTIKGTGGGGNISSVSASSSATNHGVFVEQGGYITAGGLGTVSVTGTGGNTSPGSTGAGTNYGVYVNAFAAKGTGLYSTKITTGGGNLIINGTGGGNAGSSANNFGVYNLGLIKPMGKGTLSITGTGGAGGSSGNFGVYVNGTPTVNAVIYPATITSDSGNVSITGYGGGVNTSLANYGVIVNNGGKITAGDTGAVNVAGYGGTNSIGNNNIGVHVTAGTAPNYSTITSGGGSVTVIGTGGGTTASTSAGNYGVYLLLNGSISAGGNGAVNVTGTGGNTNGNTNYGIYVYYNAATMITSGGGNVTVNGTGGGMNNSNSNLGVYVDGSASISAGGAGVLTINAAGGTGTAGSNQGLFMSIGYLKSGGGNININATEGSTANSVAVTLGSNSSISTATNGGDIIIKGNSFIATAGCIVTAGASNNVYIKPLTNGTTFNIGTTSADIKGSMSISATEFGLITANKVFYGDANTGAITLGGPATGTNDVMLTGTSIAATGTGTDMTITGKTLSFASGAAVNIAISGTTVNTNYTQLNVAGTVDITGTTLALSGNFTPTGGNVFTIVSATAITGTFTGLANGDIITFNGRSLQIVYTATTVTLRHVGPYVTTNPTNQTATAGNLATFTAAGTAATVAPTVQWQVSTNGGTSYTDISGASNTTYSFTAAAADNGNKYQAVFTNIYGSATSTAATLTVNVAPFITSQPSNLTTAVGNTANFTSIASGTPTPTVQWQVNTGSGWSNITGATSSTYSLIVASTDNGNKYRAVFTNVAGALYSDSAVLTIPLSQVQLSLKAYLQGLYLGSGVMSSAPFNADGVSSPTVADTITVELRNPDYTLAYSVSDTLSTTGQASITFPGGAVGNKYYVVIKHRNSIETWSSDSILIGTTTSYDFSSGVSQAYFDGGAKMPLVNDGSGVYLIYSGDITQDGAVDFNDYPNLDSESLIGTYPSYLATDLNGDGTTDFNDYPLMDTNNILGLVLQRPY